MVDCEKCPIAEECCLSGEEKKMCPLVALIREWRVRTLRKILKPVAPRLPSWKAAPAPSPWKEGTSKDEA